MPNFWAHRICAGVTLERLEGSPAADIIRRNAVSYRLGSQGADLMYFRPTQLLRGRRGVVHNAKILHAQPVEKLAQMSRKYLNSMAGKAQFDSTFAYVCGFLSHHAVDQNVHPFIDARTTSMFKHRRIELDFDAYVSGALGANFDRGARCWDGMKDFAGFAGVALWYNQMFRGLLCKRFNLKSYMRDYRAMRRVSRFINRPRRLEKPKYTDRSLLSDAEHREMLVAALKGADEAALLVDLMYRELAEKIPQETEIQFAHSEQWAI